MAAITAGVTMGRAMSIVTIIITTTIIITAEATPAVGDGLLLP